MDPALLLADLNMFSNNLTLLGELEADSGQDLSGPSGPLFVDKLDQTRFVA